MYKVRLDVPSHFPPFYILPLRRDATVKKKKTGGKPERRGEIRNPLKKIFLGLHSVKTFTCAFVHNIYVLNNYLILLLPFPRRYINYFKNIVI